MRISDWSSDVCSSDLETVQLGNPHGVLTVDAEGEVWTVEVGQPWRNEQAGLTDEMLAVGREVTISGARSADHSEKLVKAERGINDGKANLRASCRERGCQDG